MKQIEVMFASPAMQMFGWALIHSLWQGIIFACLLKGILNFSKKVSSNTRYLVACITLVLILSLPVLTALRSNARADNVNSGATAFQIIEPNKKVISPPEIFAQTNISEIGSSYKLWIEQTAKQLLPWVVLYWLLGVFISSLRLLDVWTYTQRLKIVEKHLILKQWGGTLRKLSRQLQISKPVILLESSLVRVPTVVGWLKPMILIPTCALTGLTPQQFELILAHELAHIRRHDYLVNLFQTIIETLLFYHPAVWWVSSQIRNERENACDDLAVGISGDAIAYARTLIEMERLRKVPPLLAMAANGGSLTDRIHRLLGLEMSHSKRFAGFWMIIFVGIFVFTIGVTKQHSSVIKERVGNDLLLNLPPLTIESLREGQRASQNVMTGEWFAKVNPEKPGEIQLNFQRQSKRGGIEGSSNTLSLNELQGFTPGAESSAKANISFKIVREAGTFSFEGYFSEGEGTGFWKLIPNQNFVSAMRELGYDNLPENYLFYAATENLTTKLINDLEAAGYGLSFKELIQAASFKITPEFIRSVKAKDSTNVKFRQLIELRTQDSSK